MKDFKLGKNINLFEPLFRKEEVLMEVAECLEIGWTGLGYKTLEFEDAWKRYTKLPNALFVNSATSALHLAIETLKRMNNWSDGDEIISTSLTFVSTNHVILHSKLTPVFADIDETLCVDSEKIMELINFRTKAVIFVGIGGNPGQLEAISKICKENNLKLILDAAHMAGSKIHNVDVGHWADVTCYSFQAVKNLPTGDSGMLCFSEKEFDKKARELSWMGINKDTFERSKDSNYNWKYNVNDLGYKYNGNSIMAAVGLVGLRYLDTDNDVRREISEMYTNAFKEIPKIQLIPLNKNSISSRHLFQIRVEKRDELIQYLASKSILCGVHYRNNCEYSIYAHLKATCPKAISYSNEIISLPLHLKLKNQDIEYVIATIEDYFDV